MKTLLVYATSHGSTAEIARYIRNVVAEQGVDISIADAREVEKLDGYDAYIFGTAIHNGAWLHDLTLLLKREIETLKDVPVYFFMTCMRVLEPYGMDHVVESYINPTVTGELNIRNTTAFAGKLSLDAISWDERWTLTARYDGGTWPSNFDGDFRNWLKISQWAKEIAKDIQYLEANQKENAQSAG